MSGLKYRKALPHDAERIFYIVHYTKEVIYPDYYTKEVIYPDYYARSAVDFFGRLHSIENIKTDIDSGRVYALVNDGKIIGTGSHTDNHITRVYVLPEYQGQGFGSLIMDELEKKIFSCFDDCELDASLSACIFYENRGYKTIKHIKYDIGNGKFMIYEIMRKKK